MVTKYLCDNCIHRLVCINIDVYKKFQDAVENDVTILVPTGDLNSSGRIWRLADVPWLSPTKLDCCNYKY